MPETYVVYEPGGDLIDEVDLPEKAYGPHEGEEMDDGSRKYTRTFVVQTNDKLADVDVVLRNTHLPRIGDIWATRSSNVPGLKCVKRRAHRHPDCPVLWDVQCDFDSKQDLEGQDQKNPLDRPAIISYRFESYTEALESAFDPSNPDTEIDIENSAGDPYDPPLEVERYRLVITIKKNMADYDSVQARAFMGRVNSTTWWGFEPLSALMTDFSGVQDRQDITTFWATTWQVKVLESTWVKRIADMGVRELNFLGTDTRPILKDGHPITTPVFLNGSGSKLAFGGTPVYRRFLLHRRADFNTLMLP